jgi:hypothetical protein
LDEKDKPIAKIRGVLQTVQKNLDAIRRAGRPSSKFLDIHENLQQDRNALKEKVRRLEGKFYAMEIRASKLLAHERSLTLQLKRFKNYSQRATQLVNSSATSSNQEQGIEMTALHSIQKERDDVLQRYKELVTNSQQILGAALESVHWQLDGKSERGTDQKCHALGEDLGMRLKPLLEKIRWQIETTETGSKSLEG